MKRLILVTSPPACGKTYISKKLAENLRHVVYLDMLHQQGQVGCTTILDVPPAYLSAESGEALRRRLL